MQLSRTLILASGSPRRRQLLEALDLGFEVRVPEVVEDMPSGLRLVDAPAYLAELKAEAARPWATDDNLILTADTVVILGDELLGKPADAGAARAMLTALAGETHTVITGVCLLAGNQRETFSVETLVSVKAATQAEIATYVERYTPLDKAGAYGIQDWWGWAKVHRIEGSYANVMGLPTAEVAERLRRYAVPG